MGKTSCLNVDEEESSSKLMELAVLKTAKKLLKKNKDDASVEIQTLVQRVLEKLNHDSISESVIQNILRKSNRFEFHERKISLKRKRSSVDIKENTNTSKKTKVNNDHQGKDKFDNNSKNVSQWRQENKVVLVGTAVSDASWFPFQSFDDSRRGGLLAGLIDQCTAVNGFKTPSPIQAQAWPILTQGRDVVGIAETGSGKTLAFGLPALTRLAQNTKKKSRSGSPRLLVLAPTRELAMQSAGVIREYGSVVGLETLVVYGGVPRHPQALALKKGKVDCLVATPGRLKDLIQDQSVSLAGVEFLVLDEADRMLDMGFEVDVRYIIGQCPTPQQGRQTAMFSATWPAAIQKISSDFMNQDTLRVYVGFEKIKSGEEDADNPTAGISSMDDSLSANKRVTQIVEVLEDHQRPARLRQILKQVHQSQKDRILLFCLYKKEAERMEYILEKEGWKCAAIHGNKPQQARTAALEQFVKGTCPLLIATDVASRGLDIPLVRVVINYTFPLTIEDYVHRIGRTGRAGQTGVSYTFFQPNADKALAGALQHVLRQAEQEIPEDLKKFGTTIKKKEHKLYGNFGPKDGPMKQATKITFDDDE